MNAPVAGRMFLEALFDGHEGKFINLRAIPADRDEHNTIEEFHPTGDLAAVLKRCEQRRVPHDVYVGIAPRDRESGGKDSITEIRSVWVDCDSKEAGEKLVEFEPAPSLIVASGTPDHRHAYWFLDKSASVELTEDLNHRLALALGGDATCRDASRILRVPGTLNHKTDPPNEVAINSFTDARHATEALDASLPPLPPPVVKTRAERGGNRDDGPSEPVAKFLERVESVRKEGFGWMATCPAHEDDNPSLSIGEGDDGRCLVHCFAGCETGAVLDTLGLNFSDLMPARKKDRAASRLLDLAEGTGVEPFVSPEGETYIAIEVAGHVETWPLASVEASRWLRQLHYEAHQEALADETVASAIATLDARAQFEGTEYEVHRRIAGGPDRVVIDRGDKAWTAISVTASGWEVVSDHGTHFHRDRSILELPTPKPGNIEDLREFANCANDRSWMMLVGFAVMCFHPAGPYPIAYPTGEQGSAKSTLSRLIASLVDPRKAPLIMGAPPVRDLASIASSVRLVGFDNVSKISPALSDALCQLATGAGYRARQLYTDAEPFILEFKRPILLNGIGQVANRPDLLDRVALIELSPISPETRQTESEFQAAWEVARPGILGALLDGVSAALSHTDEVEVPGYPRMADFARWGEAAGRAFGWELGAFTEALEASRGDLLEGSADAYPEIGVLLDFMELHETWTGSASGLLAELTSIADDTIGTGSRHWPKRADTLSNRLIQHAPLLRTHGLEISRWREAGGKRNRRITIDRRDAGTQGDAS